MLTLIACAAVMAAVPSAQQGPTHYVRFQRGSTIAFGIKESDSVRELKGDLFHDPKPTGKTYKLSEVKLLVPLDWEKVHKIIGIGANTGPTAQNKPLAHPILFAKLPQYMVTDGGEVPLFPESLGGLIFEGEMVLVIGKNARYVSVADAPKYIFGVTVGNDLQEIDWWINGSTGKNGTRQPGTYLAKTQEGSAGLAQEIVSGVDYSNLALTIRKNGKAVSVGRTNTYLNPPDQIVSYISRYVELLPGDLIYMGCFCAKRDMPHPNQKLFVGDKMEFELENVAKFHLNVVAAKIPAGATTWPDGFADRMDLTKLNVFPTTNKTDDTTPGAEK
jgi:2-keto-4-pentenoate hydratase/2-oxohepta-3-ene-1,7-dioic acid hydratase in catechol pathway